MPVLDIFANGENCWPDLHPSRGKGYKPGTIEGIAAMPAGTVNERPTVTLRIRLDTGETVLAETTLRLFQQAAAAFRGRYGEV